MRACGCWWEPSVGLEADSVLTALHSLTHSQAERQSPTSPQLTIKLSGLDDTFFRSSVITASTTRPPNNPPDIQSLCEGVMSVAVEEEPQTLGNGAVPEAADSEGEQKHPLQNKWKFWYFENNKDKSWEDNLRVVSEFWTVEDFWSIFNHIKSASELRTGCSYFVFKDGIKPMWEDPINRPGGRWLVSFEKRARPQLDQHWLEVLLCLIGEAFDDDGDDICGVVVDVRGKVDKISIWTKDCKNKDRILNIGRVVKTRLNLPSNLMTYESHMDTSNKTSSSAKHMLTL